MPVLTVSVRIKWDNPHHYSAQCLSHSTYPPNVGYPFFIAIIFIWVQKAVDYELERCRENTVLWKLKEHRGNTLLHFPFFGLVYHSGRLPWKLSGLRWHYWVKHSMNISGKKSSNMYACHRWLSSEGVIRRWGVNREWRLLTSLSHGVPQILRANYDQELTLCSSPHVCLSKTIP